MNAVTKTEPQETVAISDPMITLIERVVMNPDLPMERVTAMFDLQERQMAKASEQEFNRAFAAAMAEMPSAKKSGLNKHSKQTYSTLSDLVEASRPALSAHGLALNWKSTTNEHTIEVTAIVRHESGWKEQTTMSAPAKAGKGQGANMNDMQAHGSTETYLKRYTGFAILGMASDDFDDDGETIEKAPSSVSAEQYVKLRDALEESGMDATKFNLAYGHPDPENADLAQFPASKFTDAIVRLERFKANANA